MSEIFFILQLGVLKDLPFESVVEITGTVHARKDGEINQVRERERESISHAKYLFVTVM